MLAHYPGTYVRRAQSRVSGITGWLISLGLTARHDECRDQDLHRLAVLVEGGGAHLDETLRRARLRRPHLQHLAFDMQLVARPHRMRPAELLEPGADDAARGREIALDQKPHRRR